MRHNCIEKPIGVKLNGCVKGKVFVDVLLYTLLFTAFCLSAAAQAKPINFYDQATKTTLKFCIYGDEKFNMGIIEETPANLALIKVESPFKFGWKTVFMKSEEIEKVGLYCMQKNDFKNAVRFLEKAYEKNKSSGKSVAYLVYSRCKAGEKPDLINKFIDKEFGKRPQAIHLHTLVDFMVSTHQNKLPGLSNYHGSLKASDYFGKAPDYNLNQIINYYLVLGQKEAKDNNFDVASKNFELAKQSDVNHAFSTSIESGRKIMLAKKEEKERAEKEARRIRELLGEQIPCSIATVGWSKKITRLYDATILNMKSYINRDTGALTFIFDYDEKKSQHATIHTRKFLIRVFDENGQYLTHFTTSEEYMPFQAILNGFGRAVAGNNHFKKLLSNGNVLSYSINKRDANYASFIEFGTDLTATFGWTAVDDPPGLDN